MSVIQITKTCNLSCSYCFDKVRQSDASLKKNVMINKKTFGKYIQNVNQFFYCSDKQKSICISGGEPTLHDEFLSMLNISISNGINVYLLTNLSFNEKIAQALKHFIEEGKVSILANINNENDRTIGMSNSVWKKTLTNLEYLQSKAIRISVNIYDAEGNYDYILDILTKFSKIDSMVRIGVENLVLENLNLSNEYIFEGKTWKKYQQLGIKIDEIAAKIHDLNKSVYLDCGTGWCILQPHTIQAIQMHNGIIHGCSAPNDEVGLNGEYTACYALNNYGNEDISLSINALGIKKSRWSFILKTEFYKSHYLILPKCMKCSLLEAGCPMFCISNNIFYWRKVFLESHIKEGEIFIKYTDAFLKQLSNKEIEYALIEYLISSELFAEAYAVLLKTEQNLRKKLYRILIEFLIDKVNRGESISNFNNFMTQLQADKIKLSAMDFSLVKFIDILLKKYK